MQDEVQIMQNQIEMLTSGNWWGNGLVGCGGWNAVGVVGWGSMVVYGQNPLANIPTPWGSRIGTSTIHFYCRGIKGRNPYYTLP